MLLFVFLWNMPVLGFMVRRMGTARRPPQVAPQEVPYRPVRQDVADGPVCDASHGAVLDRHAGAGGRRARPHRGRGRLPEIPSVPLRARVLSLRCASPIHSLFGPLRSAHKLICVSSLLF